ncbi:flagellar export chaperone FlgN [Pseudoalteromonas xiamenensis]
MADQTALCLQKLSQQATQLESLLEVLDKELDTLASKSGDGLKDLARTKLTLVNAVQKLDKEIATFGDETLNSSEAASKIASIRKQLELCQHKNEVNAQAARQAQLSVQQMKEILIGTPTSVTYDQGGSVRTSDSGLVRNIKA